MPDPINRTMTPTEWALLVALATLWGGTFFFNAVALTGLPPVTVVTGRLSVAAILLVIAVYATGRRLPRDPKIWGAFLAMGLLNNVIPFNLIAWGQQSVASGVTSILNATTPIFTVIVAHFLTRDERMAPLRVAGVVIGFAGVAAMIGPDLLFEGTGHIAADLAILGGTLSYAFSAVFGRRFSRLGLPPLVTSAGVFVAATAVMIPVAAIADRPWTLPVPGAGVVAAILALAILGSVVAYLIYYRLLATTGAVNLMLVTFLVPICAILLGAGFLGERLSANHFAGMALIGLGLAAIDGRPFAWLRRRRG